MSESESESLTSEESRLKRSNLEAGTKVLLVLDPVVLDLLPDATVEGVVAVVFLVDCLPASSSSEAVTTSGLLTFFLAAADLAFEVAVAGFALVFAAALVTLDALVVLAGIFFSVTTDDCTAVFLMLTESKLEASAITGAETTAG